jgi:hypothetical protein
LNIANSLRPRPQLPSVPFGRASHLSRGSSRYAGKSRSQWLGTRCPSRFKRAMHSVLSIPMSCSRAFRLLDSGASFRLRPLCAHASSMVRRSSQSLGCACLQGGIRTTHRGTSVKPHRTKLRRVRDLLVRCVRVVCLPMHAIPTYGRTTKSILGNDDINPLETPAPLPFDCKAGRAPHPHAQK